MQIQSSANVFGLGLGGDKGGLHQAAQVPYYITAREYCIVRRGGKPGSLFTEGAKPGSLFAEGANLALGRQLGGFVKVVRQHTPICELSPPRGCSKTFTR